MSRIDFTDNIDKFTGTIYYVNGTSGDNSNDGLSPSRPFETIGQAISSFSVGDKAIIHADTYTETGLDLNVANCELWFEIGAVLAPATGVCLTVSAAFCRIICEHGALKINADAASQTGIVVSATGTFCYIDDVRVSCASGGDIGFDIVGDGADLRRCRCSGPLIAAFKVQGDNIKLEDCCTGGTAGDTSIGYWMTNSCDKFRIRDCASQGHETAGFQIDVGCTNGMVCGGGSGSGDGPSTNACDSCSFSDFEHDGAISTFNSPVRKTTAFSGAGTTYNIFKITGIVRIQDIIGHVTTVIPNTSSAVHLEVYSTGGTVDLTNNVGAPDIDQAPVGSLIVRTDDSTEALELASSATPAIIEYGSRAASVEVNVVADADQTTYIRANITNALASGAIHWHCHYLPISDGGFVEPA